MPTVETVDWGGRVWRRYPESRHRNHRVYYQFHAENKATPLYLHREIWRAAHGPIPAGSDIHHGDENPLNNDIGNLECLTVLEHRGRHAGQCSDAQRAHLATIRPEAANWHGTPEGLEWHRQHGVRVAAAKAYVACLCTRCGGDFRSKVATALFCGPTCYQASRGPARATHRIECAWCKTDFDAVRATQQFCSYGCSGRARWAARRARVQPDS